jgi:predicted nucleic acid-binding protein
VSFVLDAWVAAAWALSDGQSDLADAMLTRTSLNGAIVPPIWWYEIRNILVIAERRKRISAQDANEFFTRLPKLPIQVSNFGEGHAIVNLARLHQLSINDAAYLELASRERLPLATLDEKLASAALAAAVSVLKS